MTERELRKLSRRDFQRFIPSSYQNCFMRSVEKGTVSSRMSIYGSAIHAKFFKNLIGKIIKCIIFWLDGPWSGHPTARGKTNTPILLELEAIQRHPIKTHTILIDDIRCFGCEEFDFIKLSTIVRKIYQINGNYRITYARGHRHNDILVAQVLFIP